MMKKRLLEKFIRYVQVDTQSDEGSGSYPSTSKQLNLARMLGKELTEMGLSDVKVDKYGYVTASLPSNIDKEVPVVGFIAHMDTAPDMSGKNVRPLVFENYNGKDILLNKTLDVKLTISDFPELAQYKGQTIITSSGDSLLGADDKAGIAEIMTAMEYLVGNPNIKHGAVRVAFTPDEEIGKGVDHFDVEKFGAHYAYTIDGGPLGELEYENFNAAKAVVKIKGRNIHPGYAKGKMVNAILLAMELDNLLPPGQRPSQTEGYEGFFHIYKLEGSVESAELQYIIRDHCKEKFEGRKKLMKDAVARINKIYGAEIALLELTDQYYNMREKVMPQFHIVEQARQAMLELGINPVAKPIRGGTDGARLSFMGLPCPNLFTGGHNFHGRYEYIPLESMEKAAQLIVRIIANGAAASMGGRQQ